MVSQAQLNKAQERVRELEKQMEERAKQAADALETANLQLAELTNSVTSLRNQQGPVARQPANASPCAIPKPSKLVVLATPVGIDEVDDGAIPKPRGSSGNGFNLITEMGLSRENKAFYNLIRLHVKNAAVRAKLDFRVPWRQQDTRKLAVTYSFAAKRVPFLQRFAADWATSEILKSYLKNHRQHRKNVNVEEDLELNPIGDNMDLDEN